MISDNAIPHCGLELGCCSRQIPYNLVAHDKMIHDKSYQQGRADLLMPYDAESIEELIENVQKKARAEERKAIFDELYVKIMNDDAEDIIEWVQDNIIDDADEYAEQLKEQTNDD